MIRPVVVAAIHLAGVRGEPWLNYWTVNRRTPESFSYSPFLAISINNLTLEAVSLTFAVLAAL